MSNRDSMIFYRSFYEAIKELPEDVQAKVYSAIFEYSMNFKEVTLEGVPKTIFTLIKPQLDANNKRYENGTKGGRKKQEETKIEPKQNQEETKVEANKNVNVNKNVNKNNNQKENTKSICNPSDARDGGSNVNFQNPLEAKKSNNVVATPLCEKYAFFTPKFSKLWKEFEEMRKAKKKPLTEKAIEINLHKIQDLSNGNEDLAYKICEQTIGNSWSGFFELPKARQTQYPEIADDYKSWREITDERKKIKEEQKIAQALIN